MARSKKSGPKPSQPALDNPFLLREADEAWRLKDPDVHVYGRGVVCATEDRGYATPRGRSPLELVVDSSEGFIPLWAEGVTLRWRFQERSMHAFADPDAAKQAIRHLLGEALLAWGDAVPVKFAERRDAWDFEVVMKAGDECDRSGCVLASAFFPDAGRHEVTLYPMLFEQVKKEQVETLCHELGHVFGLRHFFAQISEKRWPSEVFGSHTRFTVMNYGEDSRLTKADRTDLQRLYEGAWDGALREINGTRIKLVRPFSATHHRRARRPKTA